MVRLRVQAAATALSTALVLATASVAAAGICPADLDGDNLVSSPDLAVLLASWGPCHECPADLVPDGVVNAADLANLLVAWGPCPLAPANDACDQPVFIGEGLTPFDLTLATTDPSDPMWECVADAGNDLWYCWQAPAEGLVNIDTCGLADAVTAIQVSQGCDDGPFATLKCAVPFSGGCPGGTLAGVLVQPGDVLRIRLGAVSGQVGGGFLSVEMVPCQEPYCPTDWGYEGVGYQYCHLQMLGEIDPVLTITSVAAFLLVLVPARRTRQGRG